MNTIDARLKDLGITLPEPVAPVANYVPFVQTGNLVHVSGQISLENGALITGKLGDGLDVDAGVHAARVCAINLIAQAKAACGGDLTKISRVVKLGGFVACTADFSDHPKVINGASDLMVEVFADKGRHARAAVGVPSLPLNAAVEVEAIFELA